MTRRTRRLARRHRLDLAGLDHRQARRAVRRAGKPQRVTVVITADARPWIRAVEKVQHLLATVKLPWCPGCQLAVAHELDGDVCRAYQQDRAAKALEDAS